MRLSRLNLVSILKQYIIEHCRYVTTMSGVSVKRINPKEDDVMELVLGGDREETVLVLTSFGLRWEDLDRR